MSQFLCYHCVEYIKLDTCAKCHDHRSDNNKVMMGGPHAPPMTLFDMGFFEPSVMGGHEAPHHNFVVIASMIMEFGTGVKLDVFYTMVTKKL